MLQDIDDSSVWRAIAWKSNVNVNSDGDKSRPGDTEFKLHNKKVINPVCVNDLDNIYIDVTISIPDDPITL